MLELSHIDDPLVGFFTSVPATLETLRSTKELFHT